MKSNIREYYIKSFEAKRDDFVIENVDKLSETVVELLLDIFYNDIYKSKTQF